MINHNINIQQLNITMQPPESIPNFQQHLRDMQQSYSPRSFEKAVRPKNDSPQRKPLSPIGGGDIKFPELSNKKSFSPDNPSKGGTTGS